MRGIRISFILCCSIFFCLTEKFVGIDANNKYTNNNKYPYYPPTTPNSSPYNPGHYSSDKYPTSQEYSNGVQNVRGCSETFTRKIVSHYANPEFPYHDHASKAYKHLVVKHSYEYKAVRVKFIEAKLAFHNLNWDQTCCTKDSFQILNCDEGATFLQCGLIKGFEYTVLFKYDEPIVLLFTMQSEEYRWKVLITQIKDFKNLTNYQASNCGIRNRAGSNNSDGTPPNDGSPIVTQQFSGFYGKPTQTVPVNPDPTSTSTTTPPTRPPRVSIVGGRRSTPFEFPWQALLLFEYFGVFYFICGAWILDSCHVVTGGHCVAWDPGLADYPIAEHLWVLVGKYDLRINEPGSQLIQVKKVKLNAQFVYMGQDIAMLKLSKKIQFLNTVRPICLPPQTTPENTYERDKCTVTGWGVDQTGNISPVLKSGNETVISNRQCNDFIGNFDDLVKQDMMCAISGSTSACSGDSGGCCAKYNKVTGRWDCIGQVSWGFVDQFGICPPGLPNVYTRITTYLHWISYNIGEDECFPDNEHENEYY